MNRHERGLEFKVGAFVFVGLAMLCALVVQFGRLGEGFKTYYGLTIRFADASGLLKGSDVLLAGAKIGKVSGGPRMVREGNVTLPPGERKAFIAPNSYISGARETGISDLTKEGGALVDDLRGTVQKIDNTLDRLNNDALSPGNMQNLKASIEHLSKATGALAQSSAKLDGVIDKADSTMSSANKAANDMQLVLADARRVFQSAMQGKGLLPTLLSNPELAADLRALVRNLRAHGVLFYRDSASKIDRNTPEQTKPARQGGER